MTDRFFSEAQFEALDADSPYRPRSDKELHFGKRRAAVNSRLLVASIDSDEPDRIADVIAQGADALLLTAEARNSIAEIRERLPNFPIAADVEEDGHLALARGQASLLIVPHERVLLAIGEKPETKLLEAATATQLPVVLTRPPEALWNEMRRLSFDLYAASPGVLGYCELSAWLPVEQRAAGVDGTAKRHVTNNLRIGDIACLLQKEGVPVFVDLRHELPSIREHTATGLCALGVAAVIVDVHTDDDLFLLSRIAGPVTNYVSPLYRATLTNEATRADSAESQRESVGQDPFADIRKEADLQHEENARRLEARLQTLADAKLPARQSIELARNVSRTLHIIGRLVACPECGAPSLLQATAQPAGDVRYEFLHGRGRDGKPDSHALSSEAFPPSLRVVRPFEPPTTGDIPHYKDAFRAYEATVNAHRDEAQEALQHYLNELVNYLNADGRPGHFGDLEANREFTARLNALLDQSGLRLRLQTEEGVVLGTLRCSPGGASTGTFQLRHYDRTLGRSRSRGGDKRLPRLRLAPAPSKGSRKLL